MLNSTALITYATIAAVVGGTDYFLDRNVKRAFIVAGVAVATVWVLAYVIGQQSANAAAGGAAAGS
jgi:hypothetical protein